MIPRTLSQKLRKLASQYPVVTITGPRQSGKTTLVRAEFPEYRYISLENLDYRQLALEDPRGFLRPLKSGVILDEVQRVPDLFSYIQTIVDENDQPGAFVLTGSQNFLLLERISQSLAGRTAILHLLPLSKRELFRQSPLNPDDFPSVSVSKAEHPGVWEMLFKGFYPRIHDKNLDPTEWYAWYYQTYVERDVRSILNIGDLDAFVRFVRLCAGRNGQLVNFSTLAADAGISHSTAKRWLSILQAGFIIALLQSHHENFRKRLVKSPKLYFLDSGLLSFLLGIKSAEELQFHAMRGSVFESFVFSELYKMYAHVGQIPPVYFWRDAKGHEVDFIIERGNKRVIIDVKSGETINADYFKGLKYYQQLAGDKVDQSLLVYGGFEHFVRKEITILPWYML